MVRSTESTSCRSLAPLSGTSSLHLEQAPSKLCPANRSGRHTEVSTKHSLTASLPASIQPILPFYHFTILLSTTIRPTPLRLLRPTAICKLHATEARLRSKALSIPNPNHHHITRSPFATLTLSLSLSWAAALKLRCFDHPPSSTRAHIQGPGSYLRLSARRS